MGDSSWNGFEHNALFANLGGGAFADVARSAGCDTTLDTRGVAPADFDGDGRLDLVLAHQAAAPTIYLNRLDAPTHWLVLELVGRRESGRDAVGARVRLRAGGRWMTRWVEAGSGYASQHPHALHFGLGAASAVEQIEILWPSGALVRGRIDDVDRRVRIVEGEPI